MKKVFDKYAQYYDFLYQDKNYQKESDFLENIFKKYLGEKPKTILDIACGTGSHAQILTRKGYQVTAIDFSPTMINIAKEKSKKEKLTINYQVKDMRKINYNHEFDAAICMFDAIDYLNSNSDIKKTLTGIGKSLKKGGLLIFDFWHGAATLLSYSPQKVKTFQKGETEVLRITNAKIDVSKNICYVGFDFLVRCGNKIIDEFQETHHIRYFSVEEIKYHLQNTGFRSLHFCPFLDLEGKIDHGTWHIFAIAQAI